MFAPTETPPAPMAPRFAASMIPGPPPVIVANPAFASAAPTSRAAAYIGSPSRVRAEPKTVTAGPIPASASKPETNSPVMRMMRHGSLCVNAAACARSRSVHESSLRSSVCSPLLRRPIERNIRDHIARHLRPPVVGFVVHPRSSVRSALRFKTSFVLDATSFRCYRHAILTLSSISIFRGRYPRRRMTNRRMLRAALPATPIVRRHEPGNVQRLPRSLLHEKGKERTNATLLRVYDSFCMEWSAPWD